MASLRRGPNSPRGTIARAQVREIRKSAGPAKPIQKKKAASETAIYQCPLYFYPVRAGAPTRPSFVIYVEVKTGAEAPGFWVKRGTAMLLCTA